MLETIDLNIAGLNLTICPPDDAELQSLAPQYGPFRLNSDSADEAIRVHVHAGLPEGLNLGRMDKIFETGRSWSLFKKENDYFLAVSPFGAVMQPALVARYNYPVEEVDIFCSDMTDRGSGRGREIPDIFSYPLDRLLITYILTSRNGAIFHAAGAGCGGHGYVFVGRSGAGKSTLASLCASRAGFDVLSDERIILRKTEKGVTVFGTPWPGDTGIVSGARFGLSAVFLIRKGKDTGISKLDPAEALRRLLPAATIPWYDPRIMTDAISFCEDLLLSVPAYEFCFAPTAEAVRVLEEFADGR